MNVKLATRLLSQSTVEMICYAIADEGIMLSLNNKGMYNHVADFYERWNEVVDTCNGRHGPHSPANATQQQTSLSETLALFSRWKELHDKRVKEKHATEYIFLQMKLGSASNCCCWDTSRSCTSTV
jgi:hypothetical protein